MEAARPGGRRRRARRGTVDRPLNARLVRVAAIVVAPALLALLFSVSTTGTLPRPTLDPVFDSAVAAAVAAELSTEHPSRVPGTLGAANAARWYAETIARLGLTPTEDVWTADVPDLGEVELRNVVSVVPGQSDEALLVVAHRDNSSAGRPFGDNASGTAALVELARSYGSAQDAGSALSPRRTLVLVSTDAGAYGGAGIVRFLEESPLAENAIAGVVLDGLGGPGRPRIALAGNRSRSPARVLVSSASARIEEEAGRAPAKPSVLAQLVDLGIPYAAGEQGPLLGAGVPAIAVTTDDPGDPNVPVGDPGERLAVVRLGQLGRAVEALVGSLDASVGAPFRTHDSLFLDDRAASGWTVRLTLVVAVVPFALGVVDLLVRGRRWSLPLVPALRALRARLLVWLYAGFLLWLGAVAGVFPTGVPIALPAYSPAIVDWPVSGVALLAIAFVPGWLGARHRLVPVVRPLPAERLAGYGVALAWLGSVAVVIALVQPYALVFVLPSLYAWLWLPLRTRFRARVALYLAGLAGPAGGLLVLAHELGLGPADTLLYLASLVTVGYVPLTSVVLALAWAAAAAQLAALAFGRYAPYAGGAEPPPPGVVRSSFGRAVRAARGGRLVGVRRKPDPPHSHITR